MLDRWTRVWIARPLDIFAAGCQKIGLKPNGLTLLGLGVGLGVIPVLAAHQYQWAIGVILLRSLIDGLDGALARRVGTTAYGAWLDIVCDMLFYGAVVFGMALALPDHAFWSALLLFSFLGTSSSVLAYAAIAPRPTEAESPDGRNEGPNDGRGLVFLPGLIEGTETLIFLLVICRYYFIYPTLALIFSVLCFITVAIRLLTVRKLLARQSH